MRVLLVAYEFPPSPSPQSLRWAYMSREMAMAGLDMEIVAPRLPATQACIPECGGYSVRRTFPGPFMATVAWLRSLSADAGAPRPQRAQDNAVDADLSGGGATLNWKGRLVERLQAFVGAPLFPDIRAEWNPWARSAIRDRLGRGDIDVMVTSHEPASVLTLGREAMRVGVKWVADLGDPVQAPYTPARWKRRAFRLERQVCRRADHVTVTSEPTRELLIRRHDVEPGRISVVTQGFDQRAVQATSNESGGDRLELLYTGSLYGFRRPEALLEAVARTPGTRLSIASRHMPASVAAWQKRHPGSVRLLGPLSHPDALALQRRADVLVDLGNDQAEQVPGKFYEYLGAMRPILHIGPPGSVAAALLSNARRGWTCGADCCEISDLLERLVVLKAEGRLDAGLDLGPSVVAEHSWESLSRSMIGILRSVAGRQPVELRS